MASRWLGEQEAAMRALQRAYRLHRRAGDARSAARVALQLCLGECYFHADVAVGLGWVERAERLLEGMEPGVEHGWLTLLRGHLALQVDRDPARARTHAAAARAIGHDCGAIDVEMMALALEGLAYVCEGEVDDGMRRLDEATAAAVAGELDDLDAISSCCCYLIDACKQVRDFERAAQWCEHVKGFCEQWSDRLTFAACRAHYADILIWRGDWSAAEAELRANLGPLADIHPNRISGRDGAARRAAPPPGAARGGEPAARGGRRAFPRARSCAPSWRSTAAMPPPPCNEAERALRRLPDGGLTDRAPALEALVRARLAAGEADAAREAAEQLRAIASRSGTTASAAAASFAEGVLAAAAGSWEEARRAFEDAVDLYARAGGRWEAAHARRQLARTLRALGHDEAAEREARAADEALRTLGAPARRRPSRGGPRRPHGARGRGTAARRPRALQPGDRHRARAQRPHRRAPHRQHLRQDRRLGPRRPRRRRLLRTRRRRRLSGAQMGTGGAANWVPPRMTGAAARPYRRHAEPPDSPDASEAPGGRGSPPCHDEEGSSACRPIHRTRSRSSSRSTSPRRGRSSRAG